MVERDDRIANSTGTAKPPASGVGGANRALARASDAALREGNRLALITNGPDTYDDWLAFLPRSCHAHATLHGYLTRSDIRQ